MTPLLLAACVSLTGPVDSDVALIANPPAPRRGGALHLHYDGARAAEVFGADEAMHVLVTFMTRTQVERRATPLVPAEGGGHEVTLTVPPDGVYAYVQVVSRARWDPRASLELMVHDDAGEPVRGARLPTAYNGTDFLATIAEELAHHPDNASAYRPKWFLTGVHRNAEEQRAMVAEDLPALGDSRTAGALWARVYGHMVLGEEEVARRALLELLERHPRSVEAYRAVSDYDYLCYAQERTVHADVSQRRRRAMADHPDSVLARECVRVVAADPEFSLEDTIAVCEPWIEAAPLDPLPALVLARKHLATEVDLDAGARYAAAALNAYLRGDGRLAGDWTGQLTKLMLPGAFRTATEIAYRRGDIATALGHARAGSAALADPDARLHELEASLWEEIGRTDLAIRTLERALDAGSTTARAELQRLTGEAEPTRSDAAELPLAPSFDVVDLAGDTLRLEDLRGRVVVLNFWGLGCAPCKKEIPDLNELVERFDGRPVTFVSFAGDPNRKLRDYLADHVFLYRNVGQAGGVLSDYGVSAMPTHVVIDTEGRRFATLTGASPEQPSRIAALIERALERSTREKPAEGGSD